MALIILSFVIDYLFSVLLVTYNWFKIQRHLPSVGVNLTSKLPVTSGSTQLWNSLHWAKRDCAEKLYCRYTTSSIEYLELCLSVSLSELLPSQSRAAVVTAPPPSCVWLNVFCTYTGPFKALIKMLQKKKDLDYSSYGRAHNWYLHNWNWHNWAWESES